jgi:predicted phage terminase large subunit-like protein
VRLDGGRSYDHAQCWRFCILDPAASEKRTADFTAILTFEVTPANDLLILDVVRERLGLEGILPRLRKVCDRYQPQYVGIEATGFQVGLVKEARRTPGMAPVRELLPQGKRSGKLARATSAIVKAEAGQVFLLAGAPWVEDLIEELASFTGLNDVHDDCVDCLSYACIELAAPMFEAPTVLAEAEPRRARDPWEGGTSRAVERGLFGRGDGPQGHHYHRGFLGR